MNPPPGPYPQQVVVVQKSGCGKAAIIICCILGLISLVIGGCVVVGLAGVGSVINEVEKKKQEEQKLAAKLELVDFEWSKGGFGSVMEADFKIRNNGGTDMKDIEIECVHYAPSGTKIDSNTRTIYDVIKAGETREFSEFNMGFIHSQADKSVPSIIKAVPVK